MDPRKIILLAGLLPSTACVTARATRFETPKERVTECTKLCTDVGMKMSALVIIMSSSGCVCEPLESAAPVAPNASAGAAAGGAIIAAAAAAQAAAQQQQQQQMMQQHY